jgi:NADH:ubiquinone oxidoreductase subunit F (NADH-binding)
MSSSESRVTLRNCGSIDPESIDGYRRSGGYEGLARALSMGRQGALDEVRKSLLRGRGGVGYSTADKWQAVAAAAETERYVVSNAVDGDVRSHAIQTLIEGDPHSVLEGALIAAYAVGASRCIIAIPEDSLLAISRLEKALSQMKEKGLSGAGILGSDFSCDLEIRKITRKLVAGEETALLRALAGRQAMSALRPPFPSETGYLGKPTVVENAETLANVSAIFQKGADWFLAVGTADSKGTKIITLTGAVNNHGVAEIPFGTPIGDVIEKIGGTPRTEIKAVQIGGPTGVFLDVKNLDVPYTYEHIAVLGGAIGSGNIDAVAARTCAVEATETLMSLIHGESCGKCVFCREGTLQMADILRDIVRGEGKMEDLDLLAGLGEEMKIGSICGLGKSAPNPFLSALRLFREDFEGHIREKKCPKGESPKS